MGAFIVGFLCGIIACFIILLWWGSQIVHKKKIDFENERQDR